MALVQHNAFGHIRQSTYTLCSPDGAAVDLACGLVDYSTIDHELCEMYRTGGPSSWPERCTLEYFETHGDLVVALYNIQLALMCLMIIGMTAELYGPFSRTKKYVNDSDAKWVIYVISVLAVVALRVLEIPLSSLVYPVFHIAVAYAQGVVGWTIPLTTPPAPQFAEMEERGRFVVYWDPNNSKWVVVAKPCHGMKMPTLDEVRLPSHMEMAVPGSHLYVHKGAPPPVITFVDETDAIIGQGALVKWNGKTFIVTAAHVHQQSSSIVGANPTRRLVWPLQDMESTPYINTRNDYYMVEANQKVGAALGVKALDLEVPNSTVPITVYHARERGTGLEWQYSVGGVEWSAKKGCLHTASTNPGFSGTPLLARKGNSFVVVGIHLGSEPAEYTPRNRYAPIGLMAWRAKRVRTPDSVPAVESSWGYVDQVSDTSEYSEEEYDNEDEYWQFTTPGERYAIHNRGATRYADEPWLQNEPERHESARSTDEAGKGQGRLKPAASPSATPKKVTTPKAKDAPIAATPKTSPKTSPKEEEPKQPTNRTPEVSPTVTQTVNEEKVGISGPHGAADKTMTTSNPQGQVAAKKKRNKKKKGAQKETTQPQLPTQSTSPDTATSTTQTGQQAPSGPKTQKGQMLSSINQQEPGMLNRIGLLEVQIGQLALMIAGLMEAKSAAPSNLRKKRGKSKSTKTSKGQ